jgi:5-methyltetrahydrofolate--homocysteine methyltransferase
MFEELIDRVAGGAADEALQLTEQALTEGRSASEIMNGALMPAMDIVGKRFASGELYVPEMLVAARAMRRCLTLLEPLLTAGQEAATGKVVLGTVKGDIHDIGKNIVGVMLEGAGFEVHDLGVDVAPGEFVRAVRDFQPDIVGLSALLTTTMTMMPEVIAALDASGVREQVKVMVGGAPVTDVYAREIEADGYAPDAASAAELARSLVRRS